MGESPLDECNPPSAKGVVDLPSHRGNVGIHGAPNVQCITLPFGKTPASSWETGQLELEHGIKTFSAYSEKNLFAVLEEWFDNGWVAYILNTRFACITGEGAVLQKILR